MARILVVDDEEPIREMLADALDMYGHIVITACDGIEALEKLEENTVELVLSDINMPRMHGFELLKEVELRVPLHQARSNYSL